MTCLFFNLWILYPVICKVFVESNCLATAVSSIHSLVEFILINDIFVAFLNGDFKFFINPNARTLRSPVEKMNHLGFDNLITALLLMIKVSKIYRISLLCTNCSVQNFKGIH